MGAPCFWSVGSFKHHYPRFSGAPPCLSRSQISLVLRGFSAHQRPAAGSGARSCARWRLPQDGFHRWIGANQFVLFSSKAVRGLLPAHGHRGGARRGRPRARWSLRAREQGQRSQRPRHPCEPPPACDCCGVAALPRRLRAGGRHRRQDSAKPLPRDPADVRLVARSGMSGAGGAPNGPAPAPLRRFRCLRGTVGRGHRLTLVFPTKALRRLGGSL